MPRSPFVIRKELTDPGYFYSRKHQVQSILSCINKDNPQNVQLIGQRRIGKSFLLQYLALSTDTLAQYFGDQNDHFTVVYWNLAKRPPETPQQFYRDLIHTVKAKLPVSLRDIFLLEAASEEELDVVIDEALQALEDNEHHVILLLDEFSRIAANPAFPATFFSRLRALAEGFALAFVIATHRPLSELCHSGDVADSPFFNIFTTIPIRLLSSEEAESFLTVPFAQRQITFEKGAVTEALRLSGGHPAILATLGEMLWSQTSDGGIIMQPFVASLQRELYISFEYDFAYYWQHLSKAAQQVGLNLATDQNATCSPNTDPGVFKELESRSIIKAEKGKGVLFSPLFSDYIKQYGSEPFDTLHIFKDEHRYNVLILDVLRARLNHSPELPVAWQSDIEQAIKSLEDYPVLSCVCCGRYLFDKILQALSSTTGIPYIGDLGGARDFLHDLQALIPQPGHPLPPGTKSFSRMAHEELWYLKHLGDCGVHPNEHNPGMHEATEGIFLAITLCQHLVREGYA